MNSVISIIIASLLIGIAFGFALEKSKVYLPSFIIGQMNFTFFIMLKVFLTAIATGMFVIVLLLCAGYSIEFTVFSYLRSIVGGGLLGVGVALAGACPGTVIVQLSVGYKQAIVTIAGCFLGAAVYAFNEKTILSLLEAGKPIYKTVYELLFPQIVLALLITIVMSSLLIFHFSNKHHRKYKFW